MHRSTIMVSACAGVGALMLGAWMEAPTIAPHSSLVHPLTPRQVAPQHPGQPRRPHPPGPHGKRPSERPLSATTIAAVYAAEQPVTEALTALQAATTPQQLREAWHRYDRAAHALSRVVHRSIPPVPRRPGPVHPPMPHRSPPLPHGGPSPIAPTPAHRPTPPHSLAE